MIKIERQSKDMRVIFKLFLKNPNPLLQKHGSEISHLSYSHQESSPILLFLLNLFFSDSKVFSSFKTCRKVFLQNDRQNYHKLVTILEVLDKMHNYLEYSFGFAAFSVQQATGKIQIHSSRILDLKGRNKQVTILLSLAFCSLCFL